jgi:ribonuclease HI
MPIYPPSSGSMKARISQNVYCDGSTFGNGKKNAAGGIGVYFGVNDPRNISEPFTMDIPTNQKTEIYALTRTLKILEHMIETSQNIEYTFHIYTDSEYTINCMEKWIPTWIKNDWVKWGGKKVKNVSLLKALYSHYVSHKRSYKVHHIRSHTNNMDEHSVGNDCADKLAVAGSHKHPNYH